MRARRFNVRVAGDGRGGGVIVVPFDPDEAWGAKARHHVSGTVNDCRVRVTLEPGAGDWAFPLSPSRMTALALADGSEVVVEVAPEGPQRGDLAEDLAAAPIRPPAPSSIRWRSSTGRHTCATLMPPPVGLTCGRRASPR